MIIPALIILNRWKQSIKKEGQHRRVQDDQRSPSSAEELKVGMLASPWIPIPPHIATAESKP
jgi:hypothetical protein